MAEIHFGDPGDPTLRCTRCPTKLHLPRIIRTNTGARARSLMSAKVAGWHVPVDGDAVCPECQKELPK